MPVLSSFYGIVITMYFRQAEHNPPHIHAKYGDENVVISVRDLKVLEGHLPSRAMLMVKEWTIIHRDKLLEMWENQQFEKIAPLD